MLMVCMVLVGYMSVGCKTLDDVRDQRGKQGCYVVDEAATGSFVNANIGKNACWCSAKLPKGYSFSHTNGRTSCKIGKGDQG